MNRLASCLAVLLGLLVALLAPATAVGATPLPIVGAAVPTPDHDPFYSVPTHLRRLARMPNGRVLGSRAITAYAAGLALPVHAWQVRYKTLDSSNAPTVTLATILVPNAPWTGPGRRPLVSYDVAEDGVGLRCTPSYSLRAGLPAGATLAQAETAYGLPLLIGRGWAVVLPDYEGPQSEFSSAAMTAHGVLDGIRAARRFRPAGVGGSTPVAMWGYSGGGFATTVAAMAQPQYAPELPLVGVAAGGVPGDQRSVFDTAAGSVAGGATLLMLIGQARANPSAGLMSTVDATGRAAAAASSQDCLIDATLRFPLFDLRSHMTAAGLQSLRELQRRNSPLFLPGRPQAPMFEYHTLTDEIVPYASAGVLMHQLCSDGVHLQTAVDPLGDHITEEAVGGLKAINYLADRFAGKPAPTNCGSSGLLGLLPPMGIGPL